MAATIIYFEIEGVGARYVSGSLQYRFCTRTPTGATVPARYIEGLARPTTISASLNPLTGEVSHSGLTFEIAAGTVALAELMRSYVSRETTLDENVDWDEVAVDVVDASPLAQHNIIWVRREAMRITNIAVNTLTVVRGQLGTLPVFHHDGDGVRLSNPILYGRRIEMYETDDDETTPTLMWAGLVEDVPPSGDLARVTVQCVSGDRWFDAPCYPDETPLSVNNRKWVSIIEIIAHYKDPTLKIIKERVAGTALTEGQAAAAVRIKDSLIRINKGPNDLRMVRHATLNGGETAVTMSRESDEGLPTVVYEVLTTRGGDDVNPYHRWDKQTADYESLPTRHPVLIALFHMLATGNSSDTLPEGVNTTGSHQYSYDVLPYRGLSIPWNFIDIAEFERLASEELAGVTADKVEIRGDESMSEINAKLLWPLGVAVVPGAAGKLKPVYLTDPVAGLARAVTVSRDADLIEPVTAIGRNFDLIFDSGNVEWGEDAEPTTVLIAESLQWYPGAATARYEVDAAFYDQWIQGSLIETVVLENAERFRFPPPVITCTVSPSKGAELAVGSLVLLTHGNITDSDGSLGTEDIGCYVIEEALDYELAGAKRLVMWHVTHDLPRSASINFTARVRSYARATKTITIWDPIYQSTGNEDTDQIATGYYLLLCDATGNARSNHVQQNVIIQSITGNDIVIKEHFESSGGVDIYPEPGDVIISPNYDDVKLVNTTQVTKYVYMTDDDGPTGLDGDSPYFYTGGGGH